jgi:ABC-type bacteriocin/lantibiotic exporter with double-glycine peptidase domain
MRQSLLLFARANRRHLAEMVLASVLINLLMLGMPLFSMLVYDKAIGNQVHDTLWALAIGMGLLLALELVMRAARVYLVEHAGKQQHKGQVGHGQQALCAERVTRACKLTHLAHQVSRLQAAREGRGQHAANQALV